MGDFLNSHAPIKRHGRDLPHWQQGEVIQFITFRLGDSLPKEKLVQWRDERKAWLRRHPKPWAAREELEYHRRFTRRIEEWLDEGAGSCLFKDVVCRQHLENVLMKFQGIRVDHYAWVIMPNHIHALFKPVVDLETLVKAWKGVSAHRIGRGSIWQEGYRDTLIRDARHFANAVRYIRRNPKKLPPHTFTLWESPRAQAIV